MSAGWGVAADVFMGMYNNWQQEERQEDAQAFAQGEGIASRAFNAEEAAKNRDWQSEMSDTAIRRRVADLQAAGINPMLAIGAGGASTPGGGQGSSSPASAGTVGNLPFHSVSAGMGTASQVAVNEANVKNIEAETEKKKAEEAEIRARTPTHAVNIEQMQQNIEQSKNMVKKILQEVETSAATAQNLAQQTSNLQELVPQIRATVDQLKAHTRLAGAQTTLAGAQTGQAVAQTKLAGEQTSEVTQRVQANLPKLDAALKDLEQLSRQLQMPQRHMDAATHDSFLGALSATIRALTGIGAITRH